MILHIISICAYLLVSTCAYITQLLFAGVAICYTKNLSSFDWMRVMFHSHGGLEVGTSTKKMGDSQKSEIFPSKKKRRGGGKPGTTKQKKLHHIHPQKLHQKTEFLVVKQTAPPKKKITGEKFPRFSWRKISSSGHRTCKSCSKGFSAKGSSSSSWRSEEGRCYRIRINDGMWVTYDER